jgi:hypothetical protein
LFRSPFNLKILIIAQAKTSPPNVEKKQAVRVAISCPVTQKITQAATEYKIKTTKEKMINFVSDLFVAFTL